MNRLRQLLSGRYGIDQLGKFLLVLSIVLAILNSIFHIRLFWILGMGGLLLCYLRMFSRNINARYRENQKFLQKVFPLTKRARSIKIYLQECRTYRHLHCKNCRQKIRVPKGKGKIEIKCPQCEHRFIKKV